MHLFGPRIAGVGFAVVLAQPPAVSPATLEIFTTRAIATVLNELAPEFERATGHKIAVTSDIAIALVRRVEAGEPFDCLVAAPDQIDRLIADGTIVAGSRTNLARSGIGVEVREGARKPDVSSVEAFKLALIRARSIAYLAEGQSGLYLAGVIDRLGLTEALREKTSRPVSDSVSALVASGEVELGLVVTTQILTTRGVTLVGPLPAEIQSYIGFAAGVSARSKSSAAAQALLEFLTSPRAAAVMRSQGLEPWR